MVKELFYWVVNFVDIKAQAPAVLDDHAGVGRVFWYSRDSWTGCVMVLGGYNHSVFKTEIRGSEFIP